MSHTPVILMSGESRADEVTKLLALAIIRKKSRQDNEKHTEKSG